MSSDVKYEDSAMRTSAMPAKISSSANPGPRMRPRNRKKTVVAKSSHRHDIAIIESRPLLVIGIPIVSTMSAILLCASHARSQRVQAMLQRCKVMNKVLKEWIRP